MVTPLLQVAPEEKTREMHLEVERGGTARQLSVDRYHSGDSKALWRLSEVVGLPSSRRGG